MKSVHTKGNLFVILLLCKRCKDDQHVQRMNQIMNKKGTKEDDLNPFQEQSVPRLEPATEVHFKT
jgi:hypothetical protein